MSMLNNFLKQKNKCLFCKKNMNIILSNFINLSSIKKPLLRVKCKKNEFNFKLAFNTPIDKIIDVSLAKDILTFHVDKDCNIDILFSAFNNIYPHIEFYCSNKKCKNNAYYIYSNIFDFEKIDFNKFKLKYFEKYIEYFSIDEYCVQNDFKDKKTLIYDRSNYNLLFKSEFIDFSKMTEDRMKNKIKSIMILS